jgi:hypothetical protein
MVFALLDKLRLLIMQLERASAASSGGVSAITHAAPAPPLSLHDDSGSCTAAGGCDTKN